MGKLIFVDDPLYQGPPPVPQIIRRWAIQKLAESGTSVGDIARRYGLSYHRTYNEITAALNVRPAAESAKPAAVSKSKSSPAGGRPITEHSAAEIATWSRKKIEAHLYVRGLDAESQYGKRLAAALERLDPNWGT